MLLFARLLVLVSLFSGAAFAYDPPAEDSRLVLDRQGVRIWSYQVPNSPLYGFKAVSTVKSSLSGLVALIADTENARKWIYRTKSVEPLERNDADLSFSVRVITDFPWPFRDREAVVSGHIVQDPQTLKVRIDSNSINTQPPRACCVRMPMVEGSWIFRPIGNGMVEITMTGHADPGGYIPASAVNLLIQEYPYNTLKGLRKLIGDDRYQKSHFPNIHEPTATHGP
ncbi:hypothetical protein EV700_2200 [Fluviicoccus keumensis]|uniref:START domain-containing protein n=2 Tax=Fluviicoccus keumensis TaxID=1435465 RepID=A0A4Q7YKR5_9GAMM|nr:hypothetical protein EV700_2200 [Fluviicoccus keumensis]